ncbi:unnamed protein product [Ostreobium quekettii]|uniref:FAD-binding domain-containing protein n=1 Tax=Ostreobium quekettii TaxID=121088 RepID=A0A8S1JB34_9CHLO|nr:unnamed protein product [Ostreobium quekettii]|eukprot:evm.model.scf_1643.5 EVM.evm.TU.scf_1643.5   scf_1643:31220-34813(+)
MFGEEAVAVETPAGGGVVVRTRRLARGAYCVLADGANSRLRRGMGVQMVGGGVIQHLVSMHFRSPTLAKIISRRPGMLYFVCGPEAVVTLVVHSLKEAEFVAQIPFFPPLQSLADFSPEVCRNLVEAAAGAPCHDVDIRDLRTWGMRAQVAEKFSVGNRVFLMGDAAHVFPPAGGFGMNTGIHDAHNLAWKLAAVLKGVAGEDLLATYEQERKPIAENNAAVSVANWEDAIRVPAALGLDPSSAALLNHFASGVAAKCLPAGAAKGLLNLGLFIGRRASGLHGPMTHWRRQQLTSIFESGKSLRLLYPNEDLAYRYESNAVLEESIKGRSEGAPSRSAPFVPATRLGVRLPHCPLLMRRPAPQAARTPGTSDVTVCGEARPAEVSTLDLVPSKDVAMLLLVGDDVSDGSWAQAAVDLQRRGHRLQIARVCMGAADVGTKPLQRSSRHCSAPVSASGNTQTLIIDHAAVAKGYAGNVLRGVDVAEDAEGRWNDVRGVGDDGAVMVRPDGHVCWMSSGRPERDGCAELLWVLNKAFCRSVGNAD